MKKIGQEILLARKKLREKSCATVLNRQASLNFATDKNKAASGYRAHEEKYDY